MINPSHIPFMLVGLRFAIAPLLLLDAVQDHQTRWLFLILYIIAVLSDIFDGIIARRLNVSTQKLRQADSWADVCLYLSVALSTWLVYPQVILEFRMALIVAIAAQIALYLVSLIKFKQPPSFHTYTAKIWGLTLLVATIALFGFNYSKTLWLAIILCVVNSFEEIVMIFILPEWKCDVLSIFHAIQLRQTLRTKPSDLTLDE